MKIIRTLVLKEIRDILRDKKTLIMMVAIPLLLYPLMIIGMALVMSSVVKSQADQVYRVAYLEENKAVAEELSAFYKTEKEEEELQLSFIPVESKKAYLADESFAVWLDITQKEMGLQLTVEYNSTNQASAYAKRELEDLAEGYKNKLLKENLEEEGLKEDFLYPVVYEAEDKATPSESMGINLGGSLGMLLIVTIMLGAFYPVIDATTGEKERGTLETLLTLPVTNFQMIMSKYIAVALFACITAILSILSLGGSVAFLVGSVVGEAADKLPGIDGRMLIIWLPVLLLVVLVTALLLTAVSMCFCIFAKSFKEANNYITPVMLIVMFASMASMLPSLKLDYRTALIPIVNVSLLVKQVMAQQMDLVLAGITIGINLGFGILLIWLLSRIYNSENVLFKDGFQSFSLFEKRSEIKKGTIPKTGDLILAITILVLFILYLGTAVSARSVMGGTIVNQLLILGMPLVLAWYMKIERKKLFSMKVPGFRSAAGGIFLYIGTFSISILLSFALTKLFPGSTQNLNQSFDLLMQYPFFLIVVVIAVMPAIGEELFFRGLLLGSWKQHYGTIWGILLSSFVFGCFHMSLVKLIPTMLLGACFAYITCCTQSIYVGMALHFANNFLSLLTMKYSEQMEKVLPIFTKTQLLTQDIVILLAVAFAAGGLGTALLKRKKQTR